MNNNNDNTFSDIINGNVEADRFLESAGTCFGKNYPSAMVGFLLQFKDTFFYANVIQFLIVCLMYMSIGKGKYWQILFYASVAGLLGAIIENGTVAYICQESLKQQNFKVYSFLLDEIFWIACEYSIPILNLIKMKAFSKGTLAKCVNYLIIGLFVPFTLCRLAIGYERMNKGYLSSPKINNLHGYAFGFMAMADIICTISILYFVKKHNQQSFSTSNISHQIKHSSYTILVAVDVVGALLSILSIITNFGMFETFIPTAITMPFHCLKSSFVLILASDALLFKYGATTSTLNSSSGSSSRTRTNNDYNNGKSNHYVIDMQKSLGGNVGYKTLAKNNIDYNSSYNTLTNPPKTIVKNYTSNIKPSPNTYSQTTYHDELPQYGGYYPL